MASRIHRYDRLSTVQLNRSHLRATQATEAQNAGDRHRVTSGECRAVSIMLTCEKDVSTKEEMNEDNGRRRGQRV